jgi:hypothetical protein
MLDAGNKQSFYYAVSSWLDLPQHQFHIDCKESMQWVWCLMMDAMDSAFWCLHQKSCKHTKTNKI